MAPRRLLHALHLTAMGLWFGSLAMTAAAAAVTFPILKALNPSLPAYAAYSGDHWMLAAGKVANTLFKISDTVQFICAFLAIASLLAAVTFFRQPWRNRLTAARAVLLGAALGLLCYHLLVLGPRMNSNLLQYWAYAQHGVQDQADIFKAAFTAEHPTASRVMGSICILVGLAFSLAAYARDTDPEAPLAPTLPRSLV